MRRRDHTTSYIELRIEICEESIKNDASADKGRERCVEGRGMSKRGNCSSLVNGNGMNSLTCRSPSRSALFPTRITGKSSRSFTRLINLCSRSTSEKLKEIHSFIQLNPNLHPPPFNLPINLVPLSSPLFSTSFWSIS